MVWFWWARGNSNIGIKMTYNEFLKEMDEVVMGIGDVADRLEVSIDEIKGWKDLESVPQKAIDLIKFERENMIDDEV